MSWLSRSLRSTIGTKIVVADSGPVPAGLASAHMLGNLQTHPQCAHDYVIISANSEGRWIR